MKLSENTVRDGEAGIREELNKSSPQKRAPIDPTSLPKTHKLAIDLRSPITAIPPPNQPSNLQTARNSNKMSTEYTQSISATGSSGHTGSSIARPSTSMLPPTNASPNNVYDHRQFIESLALAIKKEM